MSSAEYTRETRNRGIGIPRLPTTLAAGRLVVTEHTDSAQPLPTPPPSEKKDWKNLREESPVQHSWNRPMIPSWRFFSPIVASCISFPL